MSRAPWLAVAAMYAAIFWFSSQPGDISDVQSAAVSDIFTDVVGVQDGFFTLHIRKVAHFALFFALGALTSFAWRHTLKKTGKPAGIIQTAPRAALMCMVFAGLDEFHQYFVPGRASLISDVVLDTASSSLGAAVAAATASNFFRTNFLLPVLQYIRLYWGGDLMEDNTMDILRDAGFDVEGALARMSGKQALYLKMLGKFAQDKTFEKLSEYVEAADPKAGEAAHALKGVCASLGMTRFSEHCAVLQSIYQGKDKSDPKVVFAEAAEAYRRATDALKKVLL